MSLISKKLKELMATKKLSYRDLEEMTGISKSQLQRYVSGKAKDITLLNLIKIAESLKVSPLNLIDSVEIKEAFIKSCDDILRHSVNEVHIGEKIKNRRMELGLSQRDLARKMGYTNNSTIVKIEQGKVDVSWTRIKQFSKVLGVSIAYLMGEEVNKNDKSEELDS